MRLIQVWPVAQGAGTMRVRRRAGHQLRRHHHAPAALWLQQLQVHTPEDAGAQQDNSFQALVKAAVWPLRSNDPACILLKSGGLTLQSAHGRLTTSGEYVPVGPAACCRACLSPRVAPLDACADLNYCSGHGVCALGARVTSRAACAACTTGQRTGAQTCCGAQARASAGQAMRAPTAPTRCVPPGRPLVMQRRRRSPRIP